jgi:hypothetical protein
VESARRRLAAGIGADPKAVAFSSGGVLDDSARRSGVLTGDPVTRCRERKSGETQQRNILCTADFPRFFSPGT